MNQFFNLSFLSTFLLILFLTASCGRNKQEGTRTKTPPNIIIMILDDAGYNDFGFMGSKDILTPEIDKLAKQSVIFTDAHVSATVCAPSRAGLLSGVYQQRLGFECNIPPYGQGLKAGHKTIADHLKQKGYNTTAIGKWHIGETTGFHPNERGFDEFYGFLGGSRTYFPDSSLWENVNDRTILFNHEVVRVEGYLTDFFGDQAVSFIEKQSTDKPFFMYWSPNAVHTPMEAKEGHLEKFQGHPRKKLAAMTWSADENIGKIITKLEKKEMMDNTLIFLLSDNGGARSNNSSNEPLKGWKGNKYEAGHRIPFLMYGKALDIESQVNEKLTSALDIFTTSLVASGYTDEELSALPLDGVDLVKKLKTNTVPHEDLYWRKDKMAGMRLGNYKLIRLQDYGYRMYSLEENLDETIDLQTEKPESFKKMVAMLEEWESGLMEPLWLESDDWNQVNYEIHQALMENRKPRYISPYDEGFLKKQNKSHNK